MAVLTDRQAKTISKESGMMSGGIKGLSLVPTNKVGKGRWRIRFVSPVTGKRRDILLGVYPAVSIHQARSMALNIRAMIDDKTNPRDPLIERAIMSVAAKEAPTVPTFERAAKLLHADLSPSWKNEKHRNDWLSSLVMYAFPVIGDVPLPAINPALVAAVLRPIWQAKPETAERVKQRMHGVMGWGWAHGYCPSNPVDVVHHLLPKIESKATRVQHQPAMPWRDIPSFVSSTLYPYQEGECTRPLLTFLILTACRSGEARGATWAEIDLDAAVWTIGKERMKADREHTVPLAPAVVALLRGQQGLHGELVFPSVRGLLASDMTLTAFLRRHQVPSDTAGRVATAHGFRSSFRDWAAENGHERDLAEYALAHSVGTQTERAYQRSKLLEQRRPMMEAWASFVMGLV